MPGVTFSGSLDGHLRAYDTATGKVIFDYDTARDYKTVNGIPGRGGSGRMTRRTVIFSHSAD